MRSLNIYKNWVTAKDITRFYQSVMGWNKSKILK